MKRIAYRVGVGMFAVVGLLVLIGFVANNGWPGAAFLAWLGLAWFLVFKFGED